MAMSGEDGHSITGWLGELKEGDQAAAQPLWERYFAKLVVVARTKLKKMRPAGADEDEEDAASSAFNSFCTGAARGKFPQLADRDDLWRLLVVITARKAMAQANRNARQKRGGGRVVSEAVALRPRRRRECRSSGRSRTGRRRWADSRIRRDDGRRVPHPARRAR